MTVPYAPSGTLTGTELLQVQGVLANGTVSGQSFQTTTAAIAELAAVEPSTAIATNSAAFTSTSTTTLAAIPGLSVALVNSGTYAITVELPISTNGTGGAQVALAASGGLTSTAFQVTSQLSTANATAAANTTTLGGGLGSTASVVLAELLGTIVVNTGGNLIVQAAQNVSTSGTMTVSAYGSLQVVRIT